MERRRRFLSTIGSDACRLIAACVALASPLFAGGCNSMRFHAAVQPIAVNLYVKIDQEIHVRFDEEVKDLLAAGESSLTLKLEQHSGDGAAGKTADKAAGPER